MSNRAARHLGALILLAASGCGQARNTGVPGPEPRASAPDARAQADSVRRSYTAADIAFMTHMIGHHAQAIAMARLAPSRAAASSVRILAERIINAQHDEIATMQQWLRDRHLPAPDADTAGAATTSGTDHAMLMPGMLTAEEMQRLAAASGPGFDRLFLTSMIRHHQGALTMIRRLFGSAGAAQEETVFKLASDVSADQTTEVARMQRMLAAMPAETPTTH